MPRPSTFAALARLAESQWGLFTRRQAEASGLAWTTLSRFVHDGAAERVAHGVYRLRGAPPAEQLQLRAAWLQLDPGTPARERRPETGVVSHRSAADVYGLGRLPADVHQLTVADRRQSRRADVRFHRRRLLPGEWIRLRGLPITRPAQVPADLLADREDPDAVAEIVAGVLRVLHESPRLVAQALAPHAARFGH